MSNYTSAREIEVAVVEWLGVRSHLIVPNVSWGLGVHECDLLAVSRSGYATEIEIKVSASDLRRDQDKCHHHESSKIKYLYFAMPLRMERYVAEVPIHAGVILVSREGRCIVKRKPTANRSARAFTAEEMYALARLGTLRMWAMKQKQVHAKDGADNDYSI